MRVGHPFFLSSQIQGFASPASAVITSPATAVYRTNESEPPASGYGRRGEEKGYVSISMISQREKGELARFYTVTDPRKHEKGYTVYKVTARVSCQTRAVGNMASGSRIAVHHRYCCWKQPIPASQL